MLSIPKIAGEIFAELLPDVRFDAADADCIDRHREFLSGLEGSIVEGFADILNYHAHTAESLKPAETEKREAAIRDWWRKIVDTRFDDSYWQREISVNLSLAPIGSLFENPSLPLWTQLLEILDRVMKGRVPEAEHAQITGALWRLAVATQTLSAANIMRHCTDTSAGDCGQVRLH